MARDDKYPPRVMSQQESSYRERARQTEEIIEKLDALRERTRDEMSGVEDTDGLIEAMNGFWNSFTSILDGAKDKGKEAVAKAVPYA